MAEVISRKGLRRHLGEFIYLVNGKDYLIRGSLRMKGKSFFLERMAMVDFSMIGRIDVPIPMVRYPWNKRRYVESGNVIEIENSLGHGRDYRVVL